MPNTLEKKKPYWLGYYLLAFGIGAFILTVFMNVYHNTLIWGGDGYLQYYPTALYAKEFWGSLFQGQIPMMDFTIGEGMDPLQTMMYYGLTDPLSILYTMVPDSFIETMFGIITIIKICLSGLAFGWFAKKHTDDDKSVAIGALVYVFSGFFMVWLQAPIFLTAGYMFPLLLYVMDVAFDKGKCTPLAIVTFITYFSHYYIAVICSFMLLAYAILRICLNKKWTAQALGSYCKIALAHVLGILASCVVLLPAAMAVLDSSRAGETALGIPNLFLYSWQDYVYMFKSAFLPAGDLLRYWNMPHTMQFNFLPVAAPALIMFLSTKTEKNSAARKLKWALLICTVFAVVPLFGKLMNGMSYVTNRWAFAMAFVVGLVVVWAIPRFFKMPTWVKLVALGYMIASCSLNFLMSTPRVALVTAITSGIILLALLIKPRRLTAYISVVLAIVFFLFNTIVASRWGSSFIATNIEEQVEYEQYSAIALTEEELDEFLRVSSTDKQLGANIGTVIHYKTTSAIWNVVPGNVGLYNATLNFPTSFTDFWVHGADDRTTSISLAGVEYFVTHQEQAIPYGFELHQVIEREPRVLNDALASETEKPENLKYYIYKNNYNPGIGYMFYETLTMEGFESLDIAEKQLALTQYAVLNGMQWGAGASLKTVELLQSVEEKDGYLYVTLPVPENHEIYVSFDKVQQSNDSLGVLIMSPDKWQKWDAQDVATTTPSHADGMLTIIATDEDGTRVEKNIQPHREHAHGMPSSTSTPYKRTLNLGHDLSGNVTVKIDAPIESLMLEGMKFYAYSLEGYTENMEKLMASSWQNVQYNDNPDSTPFVSGTVTATQDGIFQLAVPYSAGWRAYVDGEEVEVLECGIKYMGVQVSEGTHEIRFEYTTPGFIPGVITTVIACVLMAAWFFFEYRKELQSLFRSEKYGSACRYVIVGCCTTALDFVTYIGMTMIGILVPIAKLISCILSTILSFFLNRNWSFKAKDGNVGNQAWKFIISQALNIGTNVAVNSLVLTVCDIKLIAFVCATIAGTAISFILQSLWVFKSKKEEIPE